MHKPRYAFSAVSVDGTVYAIGGFSVSTKGNLVILSSVEAYNSINNTWYYVASMSSPRAYFAAATANGIIYVMGGTVDLSLTMSSTMEAYDPKTNQWSPLAPMTIPRMLFGASAVNGKIYAIGGRILSTQPLDTSQVEVYNPKNDTWGPVSPMSVKREAFAVTTLYDHIFVLGGIVLDEANPYGPGSIIVSVVETYDSSTDTWSNTTSLPEPVESCAAVTADGLIYVMGGQNNGVNNTGALLSSVLAYNSTERTWDFSYPLPSARTALAAATGPYEVIFAMGGYTYRGPLSSVDAYVSTTLPSRTSTITASPSVSLSSSSSASSISSTQTNSNSDTLWIAGAVVGALTLITAIVSCLAASLGLYEKCYKKKQEDPAKLLLLDSSNNRSNANSINDDLKV